MKQRIDYTKAQIDAGQVYKSGHQSSDDPFKFVMSTDSVDRDGDIIEQDGWDLKDFRKNPIALFQHNPMFAIGKWRGVRVVEGKLMGTLEMAKAGTSKIVDEVRQLLEQGILKAVSVGFAPKEYEPIDKDSPWSGYRFIKTSLLEASLVSVPSNQNALVAAKALGISRKTRTLLKLGSMEAAANPASRLKLASASRDFSDVLGENSDLVRAKRDLHHQRLI